MKAADSARPWLGLVPYSEDDRERFFGRSRETQDLLRLVRREVLTVLFGRSGSGKSSLLKAGLFPLLREDRHLPVWIRLDHSGMVPYGRQVRDEIARAAAEHAIEVEILNDPLADDSDDFWEYLHRVFFWDARNQPVTPVLVFDQFEELFTIGRNREEIDSFLEQLGDVVENRTPGRIRQRVESEGVKRPPGYDDRHYKLILSLREDFVSRLDGLSRDMPSVMHNRYALTPMDGSQALEAVLKPGGALVNPEVGETIVRFVSAANDTNGDDDAAEEIRLSDLVVEPALLSLVCSELNLLRLEAGRETIALDQVRASGDQIIGNFYERSLEGLDNSDRVFIEDRLVTASGFRTAVPVEDAVSAGLAKDEIGVLIDRRLLRSEPRLGIPHIELTHDVLTRVVVRSRHFRREREEIESRRRLEISAAEERERQARAVMREKKARRARRARWIATAVAGVLAVLAAVAWKARLEAIGQKEAALNFSRMAGQRREEAEAARRSSDARSLALNAVGTSQRDPELALLLSIESAILAFGEDGGGSAAREIELALRTTTRESLIRQRYAGHTGQVYTVDFDHAGERLVSGSRYHDPTARVWNVQTGKEIARLDHAAIPGSDGSDTTISCARFSPDGSRIVTATYRDEGEVYLWDASGFRGPGSDRPPVVSKPLGVFRGHAGWVTSAAFAPDGRWVASGGYDDVVRIWDPATFQEILPPLAGHTARVRSVVVAADGRRILTASDDGTAVLWDIGLELDALAAGLAPSGAPGRTVFFPAGFAEEPETLHGAALSPDGRWVATAGNDHYLRVWDARSGVQLAAESHPDAVMDVAFIDDSRLVSACNDATIRFWQLSPTVSDAGIKRAAREDEPRFLRPVASQRGHDSWIRAIAVSHDRRAIATGGNDGTVRLWALPQGGEIAVLGGYGRGFYRCAAFRESAGADGRLAVYAGSTSGRIVALDGWSEEPLPGWKVPENQHDRDIRALSLSPDGTRLVSAGADQTAIVWDTADGRKLFQWTGHKGADGGTIYRARFSPDGKSIVTAGNDGSAQVWSVGDSEPRLILVPGNGRYRTEDLRDPPAFAAWLQAREDPVAAFLWARLGPENPVPELSPAALRDLLNRLVAGPPLAAEPALAAVVRRPKTRWLAERAAGPVANRFLLDDALEPWVRRHQARVYDARFSRDGRRIVTADFDARTATVWDAADGRPLQTLAGAHGDSVVSAAFRPDGRRVVTACVDGYCRIWDSGTGALTETLPHNVAVRDASYHPDGDLILTAAVDGVARIWETAGYHLRSELRGHTDTIPDAEFSGGGRYILTCSRDGTIRICYTSPWDVYSLATRRITRKLTLEERAQFNVERPLNPAEKEYYRNLPPAPEK